VTVRADDSFTALDTRTGEHVTLRMRKRDAAGDDGWYEKEVAKAERGNREHLKRAHDEAFDKINNMYSTARDLGASHDLAWDLAKRSVGDDAVTKADRDRRTGHHSLAAAVVEHALDNLDHLRRKHGFEKSATKESTMDREQELTSILKRDGGLETLCKSILDDGADRVIDGGAISEAEFVEAVTKHAGARFPNEAADVAFSKLFSASTSEATLLRKAHRAVRNSAFAGAGYPMPG
jgi:hypothetical protein